MAGEKKRCENCWVMVEADLDVCPNCSHAFPPVQPVVPTSVDTLLQEVIKNTSRRAIGRPFKFILVFLLSLIAVLAFMAVEGMKLTGSTDANYLFGDVILVSLVALVIALAIMFLDYLTSD